MNLRRYSLLYRQLPAAVLIVFFVFLTLALWSHNPLDASWFYYASDSLSVTNLCGRIGANIAALFLYFLGSASLLFVGAGFFLVYLLLSSRSLVYEWDRFAGFALITWTMATLGTLYGVDFFVNTSPGGLAGHAGSFLLYRCFDSFGVYLLLHLLLIIGFIVTFRFSFITVVHYCLYGIRSVFSRPVFFVPLQHVACRARASTAFLSHTLHTGWRALFDINVEEELTMPSDSEDDAVCQELRDMVASTMVQDEQRCEQEIAKAAVLSCAPAMQEPEEDQQEKEQEKTLKNIAKLYAMPPLDIFASTGPKHTAKVTRELEERARALEEKLAHFGITGKIMAIRYGPVVTLFEYKPDATAKISKIIALEDDLALALQALSIRIIAPIPGRAVIGFEVANKQRHSVDLASLMHSSQYKKFKGELPLVLGEDTVGEHVVVDLARMPHLLIAGSTGSGKSVALNVMLLSLLCKRSPQDLRLIVIDPKRLEFSAYADIAHLLFPIITDAKRAVAVLSWVVQEMNRRYERMAEQGSRALSDYNMVVGAEEAMPNLVVVIDELADLMMTGGRDIEDLIVRIAQMARAAGIHMIVATQRPSVDVVTGLIKVNFPSRVSFRVSSKIDSRTILDCAGAEKLLGRGDMLFLDSAQAGLRRIHGAYVTDQEIQSVVNHIRSQKPPAYLDLERELQAISQAAAGPEDELYDDVLHFLRQVDEVSISLLQRKFRIGYNRSARIIEMLESQGLVLQSDGGKTRKVVR